MEGLQNNEIFETRLKSLKKLWDILAEKEFIIAGKTKKMDMMPFEMIEGDLRNRLSVPLVQMFAGSGLRASFDRNEGIKIWFTNSFAENEDFKQVKEEIETLWNEIKNS